MKRFKLPTGPEKPSWAGLFGSVSMIYIFVDPYQRDAAWIEWLWTGLAFAAFFILCVIAAIYWSRKQIMAGVCIAMALLAVAFTAYRPNGIFFFVFVAAFGPLAASGSLPGSAAIIAGVILAILGEWHLVWPPDVLPYMPYIAAIQAFLVGMAITFVARQQTALRQILKTAERERIARDLHDILGHTLSVVILKSELARRLLEHDPERTKTEIADVERISRNALSEIREAISGYRTGSLQAEFDRAESTLKTAGITVERRFEETGMPVAQERVLSMVLREAVTNVIRHAEAKRCRLTLQKESEAYRLQVRDDGRGNIEREGSGMRGIRERVATIGGRVSWNTGPGTELTVTVPASGDEP
jgi:two-component system, NarL family, sensor histidine kinase DesK